MYFFHLYRCLGLDKSVSMPVSKKGSGRVQRAAGNLMVDLSLGQAGARDQESDTTFSQMLPLGVASHPEWWPTRLQALTPLYHSGMEAGRVRPARHVALEGRGLRLTDGECGDYLTMKYVAQAQKLLSEHICFQIFYFFFPTVLAFMSKAKKQDMNGCYKAWFHSSRLQD